MFFWRTPRLFQSLIQNILKLTVRTTEFVRSPFLDRLHHIGIESQCKVFYFLAHDVMTAAISGAYAR